MNSRKKLFWITFFSIAMGYLETAVVVYLRRMYYPFGFAFPLAAMDEHVVLVEVWREVATIIMLAAIGVLAGRNRAEKFAWFIFSFAIWDICYYVFLWVILGWPQSLFTWDILFLLPTPWVGPVLSPVIIAVTMILFALTIVHFTDLGRKTTMMVKERLCLYAGSLTAIVAFTLDYLQQKGDILLRNMKNGGSLLSDLADYVPIHFNWPLFLVGEGIILLSWVFYMRRMKLAVG